ncbi:PucR family transcriptional regulator ligand-binding domain-containing protein [Trebonia sp.]|uniref:PucR family transcriptional regulator n=1 Tax=Trebonia sp. TaxID=2767075 RepID=UPI002629EDFC|nr:PucR family transcriptional regulator ligand-binding domain-containing protein [Trebonia sp.]
MALTLREVLDLDVVRRGQPQVMAAADRLDTPVRWVHAAELTDVGRLLRGGELLLSTGIALPDSATGLAAYVAELAGAGVTGLAIELGRRYTGTLPAPLVAAAQAHGVPLVAFGREVPFVEITEAVHARIIDAQLARLRAAERMHETFTELSVAGAPAEQIVRSAGQLADRPLILADLSYQVLAFSPGSPDAGTGPRRADRDPRRLLDGFASRARAACDGRPRTFYAQGPGWLVTTVGARGEDWGRLFLVCDGGSPPAPEDTVLVERAATTLALGRLLTRQAESLERQAHRTLISAIIEQSDADPAEAAARARAMGVPVTGRQLVAAVVRIPDSGPGLSAHAAVLGVAEAVADACRDARVPALVGSLDDVRAGALLSLPEHADTDDALTALSARLTARLSARPFLQRPGVPAAAGAGSTALVIGTGPPATALRDVRRSFLDAREVADVAIRHPDGRPYYRLPDLRLRGLLHLLRDDARVRAFAERELGPLLSYDAAHGTHLVSDLAVYLNAGGNKALAAAHAHLARPTFYQRLRLIERVLSVGLAEPESRASLHVALLTLKPDG